VHHGDGVTPKGEVAALVNGFELPVAELLESGLLEFLDEAQLAVVFASLVFEERKNDLYRRLPPNVLGSHRADVEQVVGRLVAAEKELGLPPSIRPPNFKIGAVVHAWCRGGRLRRAARADDHRRTATSCASCG
jgi:superfamily II RNA helicase